MTMPETIALAIWILMKLFALGAGIGAAIVGIVLMLRRLDRLEVETYTHAGPGLPLSRSRVRVLSMHDGKPGIETELDRIRKAGGV
jgi:hypothetical protein